MNTRLLTMGAAVCISAGLVACGGGGGGGGTTPPTPVPTSTPVSTPTPSPSPTPTFAPNPYGCTGQAPFAIVTSRHAMAISPPHPIATGDTFAYSGTLSKTYSQSAPCPQPTATSSATVSVNVSNASASSPSGATDTASVETDAFPTQSVTTTTHQVVEVTASSPQQYQLFSTKSTDSIGDAISTSYTNPQVLDILPEAAGQTWNTNNPAATVNETLADGTSITRSVKSDGSYTDTETFVNSATTTISVDGLANGKPFDGGGVYNIGGTTFSYAPPSGNTITLTIGTTPPKTRTFPAWFTLPASSYISDTFIDNGQVAFDPNCAVSSSISAVNDHQIVETYSVLDPVLGYIETRTTTSYIVNGFGAACVAIADTLNSYYDYQNDTTKIDYQSQNGQPNSISKIAEYLGMTAPTAPYPSIRRQQSVSAVSPVAVAVRIAAIDHTRAVERAQRIEALHNFAMHFASKGAVR